MSVFRFGVSVRTGVGVSFRSERAEEASFHMRASDTEYRNCTVHKVIFSSLLEDKGA
jgi:hypothetical protein